MKLVKYAAMVVAILAGTLTLIFTVNTGLTNAPGTSTLEEQMLIFFLGSIFIIFYGVMYFASSRQHLKVTVLLIIYAFLTYIVANYSPIDKHIIVPHTCLALAFLMTTMVSALRELNKNEIR